MSATTTGITLSLAPAPRPVRIRAPRNDSYDVAVACQMQEPIVTKAHTRMTTRRPKISLHEIITVRVS